MCLALDRVELMASTDVVRRIVTFNRGRDPRLLARKFATMRGSAFAFYRGTAHLVYEDWPRRSLLDTGPDAWVSGDLHPENFGSYRANDGDVCFDVNDFDEAELGVCTWDVVRCLTGILIATREIGVLAEDAASLCRRYVYAYCANLRDGAPGVVDSDLSRGMVHVLLQRVRSRTEPQLVGKRAVRKKKKWRILADGVHAAKLSAADRERAERIFTAWNKSRRKRARFDIVDVAERLAGTGSMGVARYVVLASRVGKLALFDVKEEPVGSAAPYLTTRQPRWSDESERVVSVQTRAQAVSPSPLGTAQDSRDSFVVKKLSPTEDRIQWSAWNGKLDRLEHVAATMGQVTAWSHLRGAGWKGAASVKLLQVYGADRPWPPVALEYASAYAAHVQADYEQFCRAFDAKRLRRGIGSS